MARRTRLRSAPAPLTSSFKDYEEPGRLPPDAELFAAGARRRLSFQQTLLVHDRGVPIGEGDRHRVVDRLPNRRLHFTEIREPAVAILDDALGVGTGDGGWRGVERSLVQILQVQRFIKPRAERANPGWRSSPLSRGRPKRAGHARQKSAAASGRWRRPCRCDSRWADKSARPRRNR